MIDHNGAVTAVVVPDAPDDPPGVSQRLRPFVSEAESGTLVVERFRPTLAVPTPCSVRSRVDIYLTTEQVRLVAAYQVRSIEPYQLNERQRVTVMHLTRVGEAASAQRRASFRVDTAASDFAGVTLNQPGPNGRKLKPISGAMVNLSTGGVGIRVPADAFREPPEPGEVFDFILPLGDGQEAIVASVRLCRLQSAKQGTVVLGMEFQLDRNLPEHHRLAEALAHLTADLQREQLRKRRGA